MTDAAADPLLSRAVALETAPPADVPGVPAAPVLDQAAVATQLSQYLNIVAVPMGAVYPFIPKRFTPAANVEIARAIVALAVDYRWDLSMLSGRAALWMNLAAALGMPAAMCYADYQAAIAQPPDQVPSPDAASPPASTVLINPTP